MPVLELSSARLSDAERARRYLAAAGPAVAGNHGYQHTGAVLWALITKFDLTDGEQQELAEQWNFGCDPPWEYRELLQALERARRRSIGHPAAEQKNRPKSRRERERWDLRRITALPPALEEYGPEDPDWRYCLDGLYMLLTADAWSGYPEWTDGAGYLVSRAVPPALAHQAGVTFHPSFFYARPREDGSRPTGPGGPAVLFPIRDRSGALVAVTARYIDGRQEPKARTAGNKAAGVFWTPGALAGDTVIVVEGAMDALSLAVAGYPAVALMGCTWPAWLPVACAWKRVLLATDADDAGDACAVKLTAALRAVGARPERLTPSPASDWSEFLEWYGPELLRQAVAEWMERSAA